MGSAAAMKGMGTSREVMVAMDALGGAASLRSLTANGQAPPSPWGHVLHVCVCGCVYMYICVCVFMYVYMHTLIGGCNCQFDMLQVYGCNVRGQLL